MKKRDVCLWVALTLGIIGVIFIGFNRIFKWDSRLLDKRALQAERYIREGRIQEAENLLNQNLKSDPPHERSYFWLTFVHLNRKNTQEAFQYGKYLLENSKDAVLLTDLGSLFASSDFTNMAFACYIKAQKEDNYYKEVYLELGKLYGNLEKFHQAIAVWQDGLLVDPHDERFKKMIQQALALIEEKKGKDGLN